MTQAEIQVLIDQIRNETVVGANTKERIATVLENISNNTRNYKVYTALLNQVGLDAPIATILENTIGEVIWTRTDVGDYLGSNILFNSSNTIGFVGGHNGSNNVIFDASGTPGEIILWQYNLETISNVDDINCQIEIRIYN